MLNGIQTHDLCDTGVVFYQLSYHANWDLAMLWAHNDYSKRGQPPFALIAQLAERRTVMGSDPIQPEFFLGLNFTTAFKAVW